MTRHRLVYAVIVSVSACATERSTTRGVSEEGGGKLTSGYGVREAPAEDQANDGLEVQSEHGALGQQVVDEAMRGSFRAMSRCYEQAGDARDFVAGAVTLRFQVDARGRTSDVLILESLLGNFEVERCLVAVGRAIPFPRPQGGATSFEYTMEFRSTGERTVIDLRPGALEAELPALLPRLAADCQRLGADAVAATLYFEAGGTVRSVGLASAGTLDDQSAACVAGSLRRWSVPAAVGGTALGRVTLALRNQDVLAAPAAVKPTRIRLSQRHRGRRR